MTAKTWTLLDVEKNQHVPAGTNETLLELPGAEDLSVQKHIMRGGLSDGVDVLHVVNGPLSFRVVPVRGCGVWDAHYHGERIGWNSPVRGPVHPKFVPYSEPSGVGWLDGFNDLLVRCGLESNGAPEFGKEGRLAFPLHGRIANKPAHRVNVTIDADSQEITIVGQVEETRFHFFKCLMTTTIKTRRNEPGFRLHDEIKNLSASATEIQMLYHVNFGQPLLDAGSRFQAPVKTVVPRNERAAEGVGNWNSYEAPTPGFEEQVYFLELLADKANQTRTVLQNAHGTRAVSLVFGKQQLPCFTVWKNTTSAADGYVTGLEPGTNFPNPRSYEGKHGRVAKLSASEKITFELGLQFRHGETEVKAAEALVAEIQAGREPKIYDTPQAGWCAP